MREHAPHMITLLTIYFHDANGGAREHGKPEDMRQTPSPSAPCVKMTTRGRAGFALGCIASDLATAARSVGAGCLLADAQAFASDSFAMMMSM